MSSHHEIVSSDRSICFHSAGGVLIKGYGDRITVNNTLDERLRLLEEKVSAANSFASRRC